MDKRIGQLKKFRQFLLAQIAGLTAEQLNKIPEGYNNNIMWNLGHLICAQQSICYIRAGQPVTVASQYISDYMTGTLPEGFIDDGEIENIKKLFLNTIDELQADFDKQRFNNYSPSENILRIYGVELHDIGDALEFLLYHEGFHGGCITALKRLVGR